MLRIKRTAAAVLCAVLLIGLCPHGQAAGEKEAVFISTVEDLVRLGQSCSLDSWSQGRCVYLEADLDLSGREFVPLPTFGGSFEGQGHTISGLTLTADGSSVGLFRFLQEGAVVRDLNLSGAVCPSGSAAQVGGIAGVNRGAIQNCTFQGTVRGESCVGGIAGINRESGEVSGCTVSGQVIGSSAAGGVAGQNLGLLLKCSSQASVNTLSPDTSLTLQELAAGAPARVVTGGQEDSERDLLLAGHSDTGGIVGLSSGIVQSCANTGTVGYPHVGYNVGGIAGRQSGYLAGCVNSGAVYGRKDVGGIAGQAEPDVLLRPGADTLETLRRELETLDGLIDRALEHGDGQTARISQRLTAMGEYTGDAREHSHVLLDQLSGFVDGNTAQLNSLSASVTAALDGLSPALDRLADAAGQTETLCAYLSRALDELSRAGEVSQDAAERFRTALERLVRAGGKLEQAEEELCAAVELLQNAVIHKDPELEREALEKLSGALSGLADAFSDASGAAADLLEALKDGTPFAEEDIQRLAEALAELSASAGQAGEALGSLSENLQIDWTALRSALEHVGGAFWDMRAAARRFSSAVSALQEAADRAGGLSGPLESAVEALHGASDTAASIGAGLEDAFAMMGQAVDTLRQDGPVTLLPLGEEFHAAGSGLYAAVTSLSDEMTALHGDLDGAQSTLSGDLRAISRQFSVVSQLMLDAVSEFQEGVEHPELVVDSSDQEIETVRQGKITQCRNTGAVAGDRSVGGIAGSMSIEYDLDPEEDTERLSFGGVYETRAVLLENINQGSVSAKKDCAGGVAGRMDLGTAVRCENYGPVESTDGSYVGGIAGWSEAVVRRSFAKCVLSGKNYVGGIAGWASRMYDCRAIATIAGGTERTGAVAGDADLEGGQIAGNRFVDTGWAGIDGVSYEQAACPIEYHALCAEPDVPQALVSLTLTLRAGEDVVASIPLEYGQALGALALPPAPERDGCYGRWPEMASTAVTDIVLEAVYTPWAALAASEETAESGVSLALAEGRFTQDVRLHVRPGTQAAPQEAGDALVWEVALTGTDLPEDAQVPLRLLGQTGGGRVWQYQNGQWQAVEAEVNGQYLLLTMDGLSAVYAVAPEPHGAPVLLAGGAFILLAAAILLIKQRGRSRAQRRPAGA